MSWLYRKIVPDSALRWGMLTRSWKTRATLGGITITIDAGVFRFAMDRVRDAARRDEDAEG